MKHIVMSDLHGDFDAFQKAIAESGYNPDSAENILIIAGDMFGRSDESPDCSGSLNIYKYLRSEIHKNKPVCIFGNHEDILLNIIKRGRLTQTDVMNGEWNTVYSLARTKGFVLDIISVNQMVKELIEDGVEEWLRSLPYFYETDTHIIVHGWLSKEKYPNSVYRDWIEATWAITPNDIKAYDPSILNKTIVVGHWGTYDLRQYFPDHADDKYSMWTMESKKLVGLDSTTALTHKTAYYIFEE
jgi:serine/threonine protein phosphatase 1